MAAHGGICVVAGEASGDVQAAPVISALKAQLLQIGFGDVPVWGAAGPALRALGVEPLVRTEELAVMAFSEIVPRYFRIREAFETMLQEIERRKPLAVVCVDYPGFNLRLAHACFQRGHTVLYHIAPKVWAHGWSRVALLREVTHQVTCILPFEEAMFRREGVNARFVGNPLCDIVRSVRSPTAGTARVPTDGTLRIGLLPGSRRSEIQRVLPLLVDALAELEKRLRRPVLGCLPVAPTLPQDYVLRVLSERAQVHGLSEGWVSQHFEIVPGGMHQVLSSVHYAWVCSGTATLEAALHFVPMSVVYRMSLVSALISKSILRIPYVSLVNLCADRLVVPEFLQFDATVKNLVDHAETFLVDGEPREQMLAELHRIDGMFPSNGAVNAAHEMTQTILKNMTPLEQKFRRHRRVCEALLASAGKDGGVA